MEVTKNIFGVTNDGCVVTAYKLSNPAGVSLTVLDWGATITAIDVPSGVSGVGVQNVTLCRQSMAELQDRALNPYMGATVGRVCNLLHKGEFSMPPVPPGGPSPSYRVMHNFPGGHHLHGGWRGWDSRMWTLQHVRVNAHSACVCLSLHSHDGEEGFPAAVTAHALLSLTVDGTVGMEFTVDMPPCACAAGQCACVATPVNVCNHCYYNLNGGRADVSAHHLQLYADAYIPSSRATLIPYGHVSPVTEHDLPAAPPHAMDFRSLRALGDTVRDIRGPEAEQVGYNHSFIVRRSGDVLVPHASVSTFHDAELIRDLQATAVVVDASTRRRMEVSTTQPCVHVYTSNYWNDTTLPYVRHGAVCLETMAPPDAANRAFGDIPRSILMPGQKYRHLTVHRFTWGEDGSAPE